MELDISMFNTRRRPDMTFRQRVERRIGLRATVSPTGCWEMSGSRCKEGRGYCYICIKDQKWGAHRASYAAFVGSIPDGLYVCHHCDNRICVNPSHLFVGTAKDNFDDMVKKQRQVVSRGEDSGTAKLQHHHVAEIRRRRRSGETLVSISADFPVGVSQICHVCTGRSWKSGR